MATRDQAFPSRFLKAADLSGEPTTLTIVSAEYETLKNHKGTEEQKLVIGFRKPKKVLVVNVTNFDAIVDATGEADSDDWPGHKITVFPSVVQVGTEMKPCVRVRKPNGELELKPQAKKRPVVARKQDDDMDDEIPFA